MKLFFFMVVEHQGRMVDGSTECADEGRGSLR